MWDPYSVLDFVSQGTCESNNLETQMEQVYSRYTFDLFVTEQVMLPCSFKFHKVLIKKRGGYKHDKSTRSNYIFRLTGVHIETAT